MAKSPAKSPAKKAPAKAAPKAAATPAPKPSHGFNLTKVNCLQRIPHDILAGLDAKAEKLGCSRNHAFILAALEFGNLTPAKKAAILEALEDEPVSVASKVKTSTPDPIVPGSRLDKSSIGGKRGAAKAAKAAAPKAKGKPAAKAAEDEVVV